MRKAITISALSAMILFAAIEYTSAQTDQTPKITTATRSRPRINVISIADFYMRDGESITGKMLKQDKNQITIEQLKDGAVITVTFSKREMDSRTLKTRKIAEHVYYTDLAEYFAARTWDFRDDPDDFIQAIRAYEKAKQSLVDTDRDETETIAAVDDAIAKLQADREVWIRETKSRAELKALEFEAEALKRMKEIEQAFAEGMIHIDESLKYVDQSVGDVREQNKATAQQLQNTTNQTNQRLNTLETGIRNNSAAINDIWTRLNIYFYRN